jgi:hypothetical protein
MVDSIEQAQMALCQQHGKDFFPCSPDSKLGLAVQTMGRTPIHGLRHRPTPTTARQTNDIILLSKPADKLIAELEALEDVQQR